MMVTKLKEAKQNKKNKEYLHVKENTVENGKTKITSRVTRKE